METNGEAHAVRGGARRVPAKVTSAIIKLVEGFYVHGAISDEDLSSPLRLRERLGELIGPDELMVAIDHRKRISDLAAQFATEGEYALAAMFYALFFEHAINAIIDWRLSELKRTRRLTTNVIRNVNLDGKLTWLLELLDLPPLNGSHQRVISQLAQERNAFVHYKWSPMPWGSDQSERDKIRLEELLLKARKATTYLRRYEARVFFKGNRRNLSSTTRQILEGVEQASEYESAR